MNQEEQIQSVNHESQQIEKTQPKKKILRIILSIIGIIVLGFLALVAIFSYEEKQDKPWQSGQVKILGKDIQLPCDVNTFELTLNTEIIDSGYIEEIKDVEINTNYLSPLKFSVYVENNSVTGIILKTQESHPGNYASLTNENNKRSIAMNIVYPGGVTVDTSLDKIKKLYGTKPLNINHKYWEEKIGTESPYKISAGHKYQNSKWSINIQTLDGEIVEIDYYYVQN